MKHYQRHLLKLRFLAAGFGVRIVFAEEDCDGIYIPRKRLIRIDKDLDEEEAIAIILHEIGHIIDDLACDPSIVEKVNKAYAAHEKRKTPTKARRTVMARERSAWQCAESIANMLNIRPGRWFFETKEECLKAHRQN